MLSNVISSSEFFFQEEESMIRKTKSILYIVI